VPAATSLLLTMIPWRASLWLVALAGVAVALAMGFLPAVDGPGPDPEAPGQVSARSSPARGFWLLFSIGMLDTGVRMGLLTFLPFLLQAKGATQPLIGLALALVFIGGAAGKFACGWLGARFGVLRTVLWTEGATAAGTLAAVLLPLWPTLALLPLLGVALNGTSSVLYGTVPELAPRGRTERAFALFYTGVIGAGAVSPVLYGVLGDLSGLVVATLATALTTLATFPLAVALARRLPAAGPAR
jgi:MFS transporter, FSR family, fosmidomycin resistance protein